MNCSHCHGTGRDVCRVHRTINGKVESYPQISGLCPVCHGQRIIHCCDGEQAQPESREQAMLIACEMVADTGMSVIGEVNPN